MVTLAKGVCTCLLESHCINRDISCLPKVGEIVLIIGEEKNRAEWKKAKVLRLVKGKDNVVRGIILLHRGNQIERPVRSVCPLEIRSSHGVQPECIVRKQQESTREKRTAAVNADLKTKLCLEDKDDRKCGNYIYIAVLCMSMCT